MYIADSGRNALAAAVAALSSILLLGACASNPVAPPAANPEIELAGLPLIPAGADDVRHGTIIDTDSVQGSAFFLQQGASAAGSTATITAGDTPGSLLSWAVYQHAARPAPAEPYMLHINGYFQDPDPVDTDPNEGYYVAYADYSLGHWVLGELTRTAHTRVRLPDTANVVSPAGFIYTAVIAYNGCEVKVTNVHVGYDLGLGYEQNILPGVDGSSAGQGCDIELDESGNPQIAYMHKPYVAPISSDNDQGELYIAVRIGADWDIEAVPTAISVDTFDFAIGSAGRRAIVFTDSDGFIQFMLDTGSGVFSPEIPLTLTGDNTEPTVTFINGADDPLGELDTALVVYGVETFPNINSSYYRSDGVNPPASGLIYVASTPNTQRICVTGCSDNTGVVAVPVKPGLTFDCSLLRYSALADTWTVEPALWIDLDADGSFEDQWLAIAELPSGAIVAGYRGDTYPATAFASYLAGVWTSGPADWVSCTQPVSGLDIGAYSDGSIVLPAVAGAFVPMLYEGTVGGGAGFDPLYFSTEPNSSTYFTLAVDSADAVHLAYQRPFEGTLVYRMLDGGGMSEEQMIDNGAGGTGLSTYFASIATSGDTIHLFCTDQTHGQILYSRNTAGVWELEQQPILTVQALPYFVGQAGVLESTGQVYVAWLDMFDVGWKLLVSDPLVETWQLQPSLSIPPQEFVQFADDETSIAALFMSYAVMGDSALYFELGLNDPAGSTRELVTSEIDYASFWWSLAYNSFNGDWYLAAEHGELPRANLFHRAAPGVWHGPFMISEVPDGPANPRVELVHLSCGEADGRLYAVTREREDGSSVNNIRVWSSSPSPIQFSTSTLVTNVDTVVMDYGSTVAATGPGGLPSVAVVAKLPADTTWDFEIYNPQGAVWPLAETWDSPLVSPFMEIPSGIAVMDSGLPVLAYIEDKTSEPLYGRVFVYYPWE